YPSLLPQTTTGPSETPPAEPTAPFFDPEIFRSYLLALLPPVIGAWPSDLERIFDADFEERVSRFSGEGGNVLYVVKAKDEVEGDSEQTFLYQLTQHLTYHPSHPSHVLTLALIKPLSIPQLC
ncbi:hypothetical protein C8J55DRAFT_201221, partial [Lentinula edodes]